MAIALRFNPDGTSGGDVAVFTTSIANNAGTSAWTAEFKIKLIAGYPTTGNWYILGSNNTSGSGFALRQASGDGALAIITGNTFRVASSAGYILNDGLFHTYRVEHDAGGALRFYRDGNTTPYFSTTYTFSGVFNCNRFGAGTTTATVFTPMELEYFSYTGSTGGRTWRADLSSGTGNELKTDEGTNFANMAGFTTVDADKWINYGGVPEFTVDIAGTYAGYTASVIADATEPVFTVSVAASYVSYIAAVNSTNTKPVKSASIVSTYPAYTTSVSATGGNVTYNSSINATYPQYTASVAVADVNKLSISTSYPAYTSNVISTNTKPIKTASVITTYPVYTVGSVLTNIDPIKTASVNTTYPSYSVSCTLTNVDPSSGLVVNSSYPKYTASINATTLGQDKTLSINSSYPTYIATVVIGDYLTLPYRGGKGAHLVISLGSRDVIIKDKSRNVKWRVENARL